MTGVVTMSADLSAIITAIGNGDDVPDRATATSAAIPQTCLHIDGAWVDAQDGGRLAVIDPATGEDIVDVAEARSNDVGRAVAAARRAFDDGPWSEMTPIDRSRVLWRIAELIDARRDEFARLVTLEHGKPYKQALTADVTGAIAMFEYFAGMATQLNGRQVSLTFSNDFHAYTEMVPHGVCGLIVPWNYPLSAPAWKLAPALAAGNTVVLKPAEATPLTALLLAEVCVEAGLPAGVLNVVPGYGPTAGAALAGHPGVDKVSFTGSTSTGRAVAAAALENFQRLTLELGGKSPNIILDDADLDEAVIGAALGVFSNMGEQCVAGTRLYVHERVYEDVLERFAGLAAQLPVGDGFAPGTVIGPLVSAEHQARVAGYLDAGVSDGARVVSGGQSIDGQGYYFQPTVFADATSQMSVVREEIFGPVVVVTPFSDLDQVAGMANDSPYGLAAGVWTRSLSAAHLLGRRLRAGIVWVNCYSVFDPGLPFGGFKQSGWGREMGTEVMREYTETRSTAIRLR